MSSDVIADMLSQIKNASMVSREYVELPHSKMREAVVKVLEDAEFVGDIKTFKEKGAPHKSLRINLLFEKDGTPRIRELKRVSKPGRRIYQQSKDIKKINPKYGVVVISTPEGVMSGEEARKKNLGGEIICEVK